MSDREGRKINRRDFIKSVSKAALPTIAVIGLARPGRAAAKAQDGSGKTGGGPSAEPTNCVLTCEGGCRGCEGECLGTCKDACFLTCEGSCKYTCEGGCTGACEGTCKGTCEGGCSGGAW